MKCRVKRDKPRPKPIAHNSGSANPGVDMRQERGYLEESVPRDSVQGAGRGRDEGVRGRDLDHLPVFEKGRDDDVLARRTG